MEDFAKGLLTQWLPHLANQRVGLSFNIKEHIIYVNDVIVDVLGYDSADEIISLHPFMLSPHHQPDGELSATKAQLMLKKAQVLGKFDFDWQHQRHDKSVFDCHIHLFDLSDNADTDADMFAVWEFN